MSPAPVLSLSPVVAGAWRMDSWGWSPQQRLRWIEQCVELGVTSFDHADIYGGYQVEGLFGEALALAPALRQRLQIVTKCGIKLVSTLRPSHRLHCYDTSAGHIVASVEQSLRALRTDRLDLLLIHRPDPLMDAAEIAGAVQRLQREGKVLHFGVSNFTPSQFELLDAAVPLATNQIELHPLHAAPLWDGTLDQAQRLQRRPMVWSPLAGGRVFAGEDEAARRLQRTLQSVGERLGRSPATVAYAWLMRLPSRPIPVAGSRRIEALREAWEAQGLAMDAETWHEILLAGQGREVP